MSDPGEQLDRGEHDGTATPGRERRRRALDILNEDHAAVMRMLVELDGVAHATATRGRAS
jgi:hypothetical protein